MRSEAEYIGLAGRQDHVLDYCMLGCSEFGYNTSLKKKKISSSRKCTANVESLKIQGSELPGVLRHDVIEVFFFSEIFQPNFEQPN